MLENELHDNEPNIDGPDKSRPSGIDETSAADPAPRARGTRRRSARSAAAPDAAAETAPAAQDAPVAHDAAAQNAPAGDAAVRTPARRTRRAASRPAGAPTADGPAATGSPAASSPAAEPGDAGRGDGAVQPAGAAGQAEPAGAGETKTTRTRTRRTRTTKAGAGGDGGHTDGGGPAVASAQAQGTAAGAVGQGATGGGAGQGTTTGRPRRSATGGPGKGTTTGEPGQQAAGGAAAVTTPFVPPFSPPFAAPAASGQPASEPGFTAGPAPAEAAAGVPAVAFQPPQVIFQQPAAPVAPPRDAEPAPAKDTEPAADRSADRPADADDADGEGGSRRRRRRGSRSRSRTAETEGAEDSGQTGDAATGAKAEAGDAAPAAAGRGSGPASSDAADEDGDEAGAGGSRKRRRKRRRGSAADADQAAPDDPPNTVVHVRPARAGGDDPGDEVQMVRGSTRLEAKRQRRKEGRDSGRRRPPVVTESEFLARREAVDRVMVVRQNAERTQIAVLEDGVLVEHYVDRGSHQSLVGNVYLGKVQNVLPSMEAAFVDIGKGRNAVLYAGEVNFDASGLEGESKRIESALKSGQSVLVQVTKDPVGHKGARLTSQVSLPGRYLVYVPGGSMMGISRKLPDTERARLKQILKQVMPDGAGVIVRTAAEGASEEELAHDVARLSAQWESIERKSKSASPPELLSSEPDLTIRVIRDIFNEDFTKLVVSGDEGWDLVEEYVKYVAPHLSGRLEHWTSDADVFAHYRVDEHLSKALERKVWLPSGGSLVIDNTEAMTVIDVNTGKFTGQGGNLEETVTRNNLEAAEEIVRQLRLRDVGGIIVIDFIDMVLESNRELVLRRLLECLARDRTKHQVAEVTSLGLVQMTRKRVGSGLLEAFSEPCECCNGRGLIISLDGFDHAGHTHRGRQDGGANGGKPSRDGKSGKDGRHRQGKQDRDEAERKASAQAGIAQVSSAQSSHAAAVTALADEAGAPDGAEPAADGVALANVSATTVNTTAGNTTTGNATTPGAGEVSVPGVSVPDGAGAGEQPGGGTAGEPANAAEPQASGGGRRRRAATREPGPPDNAAGTEGAPGTEGQAPAEASAAAGV
jgi:ribonuclease E